METNALLVFTSHIDGKNAKVSIYSDRVEWLRSRGISAGKITAGIMTGGTSLLVTGVGGGKAGTEMVPIKSISSVTTKRDGMINTKVVVIVSGNTIEFRVSHAEAAQVKDLLTQLVLGSHPSQKKESASLAIQETVPVKTEPDLLEQIKKLGELKEAGLLTDEEFNQKKAQLLERM